jgi:hypothetical protein
MQTRPVPQQPKGPPGAIQVDALSQHPKPGPCGTQLWPSGQGPLHLGAPEASTPPQPLGTQVPSTQFSHSVQLRHCPPSQTWHEPQHAPAAPQGSLPSGHEGHSQFWSGAAPPGQLIWHSHTQVSGLMDLGGAQLCPGHSQSQFLSGLGTLGGLQVTLHPPVCPLVHTPLASQVSLAGQGPDSDIAVTLSLNKALFVSFRPSSM